MTPVTPVTRATRRARIAAGLRVVAPLLAGIVVLSALTVGVAAVVGSTGSEQQSAAIPPAGRSAAEPSGQTSAPTPPTPPTPDAPTGTARDGTGGGAPAEPSSRAPAREVERMHDALHALGRECDKDESRRSAARIERAVDTVLSFARRYPEGRFAVDDETGSALSLLVATREDLRSCAPAASARVSDVLPPGLRN